MTAEQRFIKKVEKTDNCWLWTGATNKGYGVFYYNGKLIAAHRYAYIKAYDFIPDGLTIDHLCLVKNCVNPEHLETVSGGENARRGVVQRVNKTGLKGTDRYDSYKRKAGKVCSEGHEYTPENTLLFNTGVRVCAKCWYS